MIHLIAVDLLRYVQYVQRYELDAACSRALIYTVERQLGCRDVAIQNDFAFEACAINDFLVGVCNCHGHTGVPTITAPGTGYKVSSAVVSVDGNNVMLTGVTGIAAASPAGTVFLIK